MPKVSVILSSYNHADYIGESIESILNQTFKDFELYIIDDHSTDNSWDIINKYKDERIIKIRNTKNMGYCMTKKLCNKLKGEYFAIAHCDDKWEKDKLEKQVKVLDENKKIAACFTHVKVIDENGINKENFNDVNFNVTNKTRFEWLNYFFYNGNCLCHPSLMMRKKIQLNDDLFTYGLGSLPDFYRWVKLCLKHDIYIIEEKLTCFRIRMNGANTSGYNKKNLLRYPYELLKVLELYRQIGGKDLVKVFPEIKKYKRGEYFNKDFALAQICLENTYGYFQPHHLLGLNILYELLQNEKEKNDIEKYNAYTLKSFMEDTSKYDVFRREIDFDFLESTLFMANDQFDFNTNNIIQKQIYINGDNFNVHYNNINKNFNKFRFDPDENKFRLYYDIIIKINGKIVELTSNAIKKNDNTYYFDTLDPMFFFEGNNIKEIEINGKTRKMSDIEINQLFSFNNKDTDNRSLIQKIASKLSKK